MFLSEGCYITIFLFLSEGFYITICLFLSEGLAISLSCDSPIDSFRREASLVIKGHLKELKNELNVVKTEVGVYREAVETLLKESDTNNEVELFLESIGKDEEGMVPFGIELCADTGLVVVNRLLERDGFPRTDIYDFI